MDFVSFILSAQVREVTASVMIAGVVALIITGALVPGRTHKRELAQERARADEHKAASEKKDGTINVLVQQNSQLLAGVRIADKFYRDFIPAPDDATVPKSEVPDVGT